MRDKVVRWKERVKKRVKARMETEREGGQGSCMMARKLSLIPFYPSAIQTAL